MTKIFIFCHGFGFSSQFWHSLLSYFHHEQTYCIDLGYFGPNKLITSNNSQNNVEYIGVGHSLGLIKLIQSGINFKYLIGLNSFINFLGHDKNLQHIRYREYNFFKKSLTIDPERTLSNFYNRCGLISHYENLSNLNLSLLLKDLELMTQSVTIKQNCYTLIINSLDDKIVPPVLTNDNFTDIPNIGIHRMIKGKHALGFLQPAKIYQKIQRFIR
ncbi:MAG: hypothetical protein AB8B66_01750 [Rickettsiaceae bacterium]